ncbi:MAG: glycosyltransferase family 4 protein [Thermoleophilia bacterium]
MRILVVHQYFLEANQGGGSRFNQLTRYWREAGNQVTVVAGSVHYATGERTAGHHGVVLDETTADGIRVRRCYVSPSYNSSFLGRLWAYVSFMLSGTWAALTAGPHDIVVATSPPLFAGIPGLVVSLLRRRPFVFEVRDLWPESAIETGVLTNSVLIRLSYYAESLLYRRATAINVLTPAFREHLIAHKDVPAEKIWYIPNAADLDLFSPGPTNNAVRREYGLDGRFVVSYMGAHGLANGLDQILDAAEILRDEPDVVFMLIGDGMEKPRLREQARARSLCNVLFVDNQPKERMADFCNASDVCSAVLRKAETFKTVYPNKLFDYMACARPSIVAIDGVARKLVEDAGAGLFVPPEDPEKLAAAVLYLRDNPKIAKRMGASGRAFVEKHFDRSVLALRYERLLRSLIT